MNMMNQVIGTSYFKNEIKNHDYAAYKIITCKYTHCKTEKGILVHYNSRHKT